MYLELLAKRTFTIDAYYIDDNEDSSEAACWIPDEDDLVPIEFKYGSRREISRIDHEDDEYYYGVEFAITGFVFVAEVIHKELAIIDDLFAIQDLLYQKT